MHTGVVLEAVWCAVEVSVHTVVVLEAIWCAVECSVHTVETSVAAWCADGGVDRNNRQFIWIETKNGYIC